MPKCGASSTGTWAPSAISFWNFPTGPGLTRGCAISSRPCGRGRWPACRTHAKIFLKTNRFQLLTAKTTSGYKMASDIFSMDVETSSQVELTTYGADRYSRDVSTRALMLAFHQNGSPEPGRLWLEGDPVPEEWVAHVRNGGRFSAWNGMFFDRLIYNRIFVAQWGFPPVADDAWIDSMHRASAANLPQALDICGKFMQLEFDINLKDKNRIRRITNANKTEIPFRVADILCGRVEVL